MSSVVIAVCVSHLQDCFLSRRDYIAISKVALSSRTNVRDLRFLAALEMTNRGRRRIFAIATQPRMRMKEAYLAQRLRP